MGSLTKWNNAGLYAIVSIWVLWQGLCTADAASPGCQTLISQGASFNLAPSQTETLPASAMTFFQGDTVTAAWSMGNSMTYVVTLQGATAFTDTNSDGFSDYEIEQTGLYQTHLTNNSPNSDFGISDVCLPRDLTHDLNADGASDIPLRDNLGNLCPWMMNGGQVLQSSCIGNVPTSWSIVGIRDFNADSHFDLLWRDSNGNTAIWFLSGNGTTVSATASLGNIAPTWSVLGTGDFNGDGYGDILWRDTSSGATSIWFMKSGTVLSTLNLGIVPTTLSVLGIGDFLGSGSSDILWRDTSGNTSIWFFFNGQFSGAQSVGNIPVTWSARIGDFNGDGDADILWRDGNGNTAIWLMQGATVLSSGSLGNLASTWSIALIGDYNRDGKSDIIWRNTTTGDFSIWFMNGTTVASTFDLGNLPSAWAVQAAGAE